MRTGFAIDAHGLLAQARANNGVLRIVTDTADAPYLPGRAELILATRLCGEGLLAPLHLSARKRAAGEFYYEFELLDAGRAALDAPGPRPSAPRLSSGAAASRPRGR